MRHHRKLEQSALLRYTIALAAPGLAALAELLLPSIANSAPFLLFFVAVVVSAWFGGWGPGLLSTAVSAVISPLLFAGVVHPAPSPLVWRIGAFLVGGVLVSALSGSRRMLIAKERRDRQWLETTVRSVADGVIATDSEGRVVLMNAAAESLTGCTSAEALGVRVSEVFRACDEKTGAALDNPAEQALRLGAAIAAANRAIIQTKDGRTVPISDSAAPIRGERGDVIGSVLVFRDVSEQRRAQAALSDSEDHYRTLAETASDAIITIDQNATVVFASRACRKIFGYGPEELAGASITALVPESFSGPNGGMSALLNDATRVDWSGVELRGRHKDGSEIPLEASFSDFTRNGKRYVTAVLRDITERKRSEQALEKERARTQEALEMHQRLEQQVMLLVEASATLLSSLEASDVLDKLVDLAVRFVKADAYAIWRMDDNRLWRPVASRGLSDEYRRIEFGAQTGSEPPSEPLVIESVEDTPMLARRVDAYHREGIRSLLVIPLRLHEHVSATITFYYRERRRATDSEIRIATTLGNLAAAALTTAELYAAQIHMRAEAEASEQRSSFLAEATSVLASSLDYEATLATVARLAVPHFADWCAVDILHQDGGLQRLAVAHADPAKVQWAKEIQRRYPPKLNPERGLGKALKTGEYEVMNDVPEHLIELSAEDPEHLRILRELDMKSVLIAPLIARGRALGALTFVTTHESGRNFGAAEVELALHLARRAAIAVDNADLFRTAERRRQQAEEAADLLRQSNEDLEQFAYVSSHDLQEPLRMIGSYVQLLEKRYKGRLDEDAHEFIAFVVEGVDRMQRLLRDLLEYARVGHRESQAEDFDSGDALNDAVSNLKIAIQESAAEIMRSELPVIHADPVQMAQLFQNLVANAIKFRHKRPLRVQVEAIRGDGEWIFSVRDNGMGFDPSYAKKAFVIFQRLHGREFSGTGIGLAICKRIVERRGGRIWVESRVGEGCTFYFSIPDAVRRDAAEHAEP